MLFTNVNIEGRRMEYYEGESMRSAYSVEIGQMRIAACLLPIREGYHMINYSGDGFLYKVDREKEPFWILLASASPDRMRSDDENGITGRMGNIRYVKGSTFHVEDFAIGPNNETCGLDAILVRMDSYDEAIFEVEYDTGAGTELWYYIIKGSDMIRVREFNDIAIFAKKMKLDDELMANVYPRRPNIIDYEEIMSDFWEH